MRISSRGTVSMGLGGWALFIIFAGPLYVAFWTVKAALWLLGQGLSAIARWQQRRKAAAG